mmetsp:Transcript_14740/g.30319  ORF Transcript_14740/g.30319 Transcript_14740/m.30319 type:complete len:610 (-) Transcript_14740:37-1866(-)
MNIPISLTAALILTMLASVKSLSPSLPKSMSMRTIIRSNNLFQARPRQLGVETSLRKPFTTLRGGATDDTFPTWSFKEACRTMEVTPPPKVDFVLESSLPPVSSLDGPVLYAFMGNDKDAESPFALAPGSPESSFDSEFSNIITNSITENEDDFKNGTSPGASVPLITVPGDGTIVKATISSLGSTLAKPADVRKSASSLASAITGLCKKTKCSTLHVSIPSEFADAEEGIKSLVTKALDNMYTDNRYRSGDLDKNPFEALTTVKLYSPTFPSTASTEISTAIALNAGTSLCKDLVNSPPNILNPLSMASLAKQIAKESNGCMKCEVFDAKECERRGMGAYLGVARGSETEPQFIHLTYTPRKGKSKRKLAVVGKGLTFDAGGYNIKTAMMELMKFDMGGSAATLGAALATSKLEPSNTEVHFIVAACENMVSERAMRPGDILTASNGKSIEVLNTDAEGRLTLADALVFADKELEAEKIVDLATLTGACMIALGNQVAGVWTDNDDLAKSLEECSEETGDKSWRMPLEMGYDEQLKSKIADMTNLGGRYGGAITAALFLKKFVDTEKPYAHIDIAGPVWSDKSGATGFGAKMISTWIMREDGDAADAE